MPSSSSSLCVIHAWTPLLYWAKPEPPSSLTFKLPFSPSSSSPSLPLPFLFPLLLPFFLVCCCSRNCQCACLAASLSGEVRAANGGAANQEGTASSTFASDRLWTRPSRRKRPLKPVEASSSRRNPASSGRSWGIKLKLFICTCIFLIQFHLIACLRPPIC